MLVHGAARQRQPAALQVAKGLGARTIALVSTEAKQRVVDQAARMNSCASSDTWRGRVKEALRRWRGRECSTRSAAITSPTAPLPCARTVVWSSSASPSVPEVRVNRLLLGNTEVVGAGWGAYVMGNPISTPGSAHA